MYFFFKSFSFEFERATYSGGESNYLVNTDGGAEFESNQRRAGTSKAGAVISFILVRMIVHV